MEINHTLLLDLQQIGTRQMMQAKQGDSLTRVAKICLYDGGTEFDVPSGTTLQIAYAKADGKGGLYDKMPDNSTACTSSGNIVTAKLHPQMFTVAGLVSCELRLMTSSGEQLSTFSWFITVQASASAGAESEDYFRFATLDGVINDIGDLAKLTTTVKSSLVAAINSVNSSLTSLSKKAVKSVNGVQPDEGGNVAVAAGGLQIVRAVHTADDVYTATGDALPLVVPGYTGQHTGKGAQIVFIPGGENTTAAPKLQLNGGSKVQIRMRAPRNQWDNSQSPDATLPVPVGALMNGVPYTMTFCGYFWLIDSHVERYNEQESAYLQKLAESMSFVSDVQGVALPAFEVNGEVTPESVSARKAAVISATDAESAETFLELPTVKKVKEMLTADAAPLYITLSYNTDAAKWFSDVNYTADDIVEALNSRQVIAKVMATEQTAIYAPVTEVINTGSNMVVFGVISYSDPTDLSMYWFVKVTCDDSGAWEVTLDDQN